MKQGLYQTARMQQSLMLTPQLQQAIKLLTMSAQELVDEVQRVVDDNVCLELEEPGGEPESRLDNNERNGQSEPAPASEGDGDGGANSTDGGFESDDGFADAAGDDDGPRDDPNRFDEDDPRPEDTWQEEIPEQLAVDSSWDDLYSGGTGLAAPEDGDDRSFEERTAIEEGLQEHLTWQLNLARLSERDRAIGVTIIEALDESGFLTVGLEDILAALDPAFEIEPDEIDVVLHLIQQFDPVGVACRDLRECLMVQLAQLPRDTAHLQEACAIVSRHLDLLAGQQALLCRKLHMDQTTLAASVGLIRTLDPKPGARFASRKIEYIVPEVIVGKDRGRWRVELNPEIAPKLRISQGYAAMIPRGKSVGGADATGRYLKDKMQEAKWFINGLKHRSDTLMRVSAKIVELQMGFFEHGPEHLRPLVLKDIADEVGVHESTISRVTTRKYMHTPRGVYELKYFFSAQVSTTDGEKIANKVIQEKIKKLCDAEDKRKPLSDAQIVSLLKQSNYRVARRTIAKYRDALGIPSSNERRRLV